MGDSAPSALPLPELYVQTPLLRSRKLSELVGASVWLKMETVQTSGSFKSRGLSHFAKKVSRCCAQLVIGVDRCTRYPQVRLAIKVHV